MRWDDVQPKWNDYRKRFGSAFSELTADEVHGLSGNRDEILGLLEKKYGVDQGDADRRFEDWLYGLEDEIDGPTETNGHSSSSVSSQ